MRTMGALAVLLAGVTAAGCSTQPVANTTQPATTADGTAPAPAAAPAAATLKLQPGLWSVVTDITKLDMPGAGNPQIANAIGAMMKKRQSIAVTHCLTDAEAASPSTKMFGGRDGAQCRRDTLVMAGGQLKSAITCTRGDEGTMTVAMSGSYTATGYDLVSDMKMTNPKMPGGAMTMKAHVIAKRVGECSGAEAEKK